MPASMSAHPKYSRLLKRSAIRSAPAIAANGLSMLNKIADFYDQEVDTAVKALTSMIEPLIICVMGVVVGAIVICMFLPIFQMSSLIEGH